MGAQRKHPPPEPHLRPVAAVDLGDLPYTHELIQADRLEIGAAYQRPIRETWVRKIAAEFDPVMLDDLLVNHVTGEDRFLVMDGQHRLLAIRHMGYGDQNVPCKVYRNLSLAQQARRFNVTDNRKRISAQDRLRAALVAGELEARNIERIVTRAGFSLNLDNSLTDHGRIAAVGALVAIYRESGMDRLIEVLSLIATAFGTDYGPSHAIITGVASFVAKYLGQYNRARLIHIMSQQTPNTLIAEGDDVARVMGRSTKEGVAYTLYKGYNARLQLRRLSDFDAAARGRKG